MPQKQNNENNTPEAEMTVVGHLQELRTRLVHSIIAIFIGFLGSYYYAEKIYWFIMEPLLKVMPPDHGKMVFLTLIEPFITYIKVAILSGLFLSSPVIFYEIWKFIAPGLYPQERKYVIPFVLFATFFFVGGAGFGYFIVFPYAFKFLIGFASSNIVPTLSMEKYFSFATKMLLAFGTIFELPVITFFLAKIGLIDKKTLVRWRKYAIIVIFVAAAILTPPDVISQTLMAVPLLILYELSVIIAKIFGKKPILEETESQ